MSAGAAPPPTVDLHDPALYINRQIGRFLEHERVFVVGPEGKQSFFLASADWMPRNLDRRIEVMSPSSRRGCASRSATR